MIGNFKDVADISGKRFAECPLGRNADVNMSDFPSEIFDRPLAISRDFARNCPVENGKWSGERGDSFWHPDREYVPLKANPMEQNWGYILKTHGIDGIAYKEGSPDFGSISKGNVEIEGFTDSRVDNFVKADIEMARQRGCSPDEVRKWRKENGYTWHECRDMRTMQKTPSIIHNNIAHSGGISEVKKGI